MSQINVNPSDGPRYREDGSAVAAASINLLAVVLVIAVIVAIAVVAYGAFVGNWFGTIGNTGGNNTTTITTSQPATANQPSVTISRAPAASSPASSPAASPSR